MIDQHRILPLISFVIVVLSLTAGHSTAMLQTEDNPLGGPLLTVLRADLKFNFASFGDNIGRSSIAVAPEGSTPEIYTAATSRYNWENDYWYALRYDPLAHQYTQIYVSPHFPDKIRRLDVANVDDDIEAEIILALENGDIHFFEQATKNYLGKIETGVTGLEGLGVVDLDGDSENEIVICSNASLYVFTGTGTLEWSLQNVGGENLVIGQMDDDSALEIALSNGQVVDSVTKSIQWTWQEEFGPMLAAEDIDGDNRDELISCDGWDFVWAFDVNLKLPKWSLPCEDGIESLQITDIDKDSTLELIVGENWGRDIRCYSSDTQNMEWEIANPKDGTNSLTASDCDSDGTEELIWGTDEGFFLVFDWQTETTEWENVRLGGPFIGPEIGDIDGDGRVEIVCASSGLASGDSPRLMVFSNNSTKLRSVSDELSIGSDWVREVHDLKLFDVDSDGLMEILIAIENSGSGIIAIYDFAAEGYFNLKWTNTSQPADTNFHSVAAGDVDGDGKLEIIAGSDDSPSGVNVYVYDYISGGEEWHSMHMGQNWNPVTDLVIEDVDGDDNSEIISVVEGDDAYVFDGASKILDAILYGEFLSVALTEKGSSKLILLGDANGYIGIHKHISGNYSEIYRKKFSPDPVYGLSFARSNKKHVFFGSGGVLRCTTATSTLWESADYGSPFGRCMAFHPYSSYFVVSGLYSIALYRFQMD